MPLILTKCNSDDTVEGCSYDGPVYGQVGDIVEAPNIDNLYGLKKFKTIQNLISGEEWVVVNAPKNCILDSPCGYQCRFSKGEIVYRGDKSGLREFVDVFVDDSESAYMWSRFIGDRDIVVDLITDRFYVMMLGFDMGVEFIMRTETNESTNLL